MPQKIAGMPLGIADPHIGEYVTKTNAFADDRPAPNGPPQRAGGGPFDEMVFGERLLAVTHQDLIAGMGQLGAILLQAAQNGQIRFVHDGAAVLLNVVSTSLLLLRRSTTLLLLGQRRAGNRQRQQSGYQE
jgi:hypothetical protein